MKTTLRNPKRGANRVSQVKNGRKVTKPTLGPKLPRYMEALEAISKTAKFLGNLDLTVQVATMKIVYCNAYKDYGLRETVNFLKVLHSESVRLAAGLPTETLSTTWISRYKRGESKGFPIILRTFIPLLRSAKVLEIRMALSLLKCYEAIVLPIRENIDSIVTDSNGPNNYALIQNDFRKFLAVSPQWRIMKKEFAENMKDSRRDKVEFHYTTKKGINGPAAGNAGLQSLALNGPMLQNIVAFSNLFYKEDYGQLIDRNKIYYENRTSDISGVPLKPSLIKQSLGRLAFVSDKGGKTRTVAIGNYWIQNALYPFHHICFKTLRMNSCDGTFDQISQFERVSKAASERPVWSFDLTTATDRIPLVLDIDVAKSLNSEVGTLWGEILIEFPFNYRDRIISYKVGQPMGFYSSWALLALGHHAIILYCAARAGIENTFLDYAIIGDDVAIWNESVANEYLKFMEEIDVPISEHKSFVPENLSGPCVAEFAKRISRKGTEISGISPDIAIECWKSYVLFPEFIAWLAIHNFSEVTKSPFSRVISLMNLTKHQESNCLSMLHINSILCQPSINLEGLSLDLIPTIIRSLEPITLMDRRLSLLTKRCSDDMKFLLRNSKSSEKAELERLQMADCPQDLVFKRILNDSVDRYDKLRQDFASFNYEEVPLSTLVERFQPNSEYEGYEPTIFQIKQTALSYVTSGSRSLLNTLKTIEYLPPVRFADLVSGLTSHDKTYIRRGRYIRDLMKHIVRPDPNKIWGITPQEAIVVKMNTLRMLTETIACNRTRR